MHNAGTPIYYIYVRRLQPLKNAEHANKKQSTNNLNILNYERNKDR